MGLKLMGIILVLAGCGGFGFKLVSAHIKEERCLRTLIRILDYMECELQYRLTPLPELCRQAGDHCSKSLKSLFNTLATELDAQIAPDAERCMCAALYKHRDIPPISEKILEMFGRSLGRFDLCGQLKGIDDIRNECNRHLQVLMENKDVRIRNYRTLAICAGAALAILFI